ncbi:MAG: B12-binding domain-containing radical SAM protein [Gammaproteobacteria bacterium]|nr:B12-binding domain-containing radical SAM protein [Gammaproteobacteria bacterium]
MNYLLVLPKDSAKSSGGYNVFPVGIAYVSAYLKTKGHSVFTANLEFFKASTHDALRHLIETYSIDVLGTSGLSRDYQMLKELIDTARSIKPRLLVVLGGGIISGDPMPAMIALKADIGVIGQGEITMHELATALDNGLSYEEIPGLIFKSGARYITTSARQEVKNLDYLPFPDYDGFSFPEYMRQINYDAAYIIASRSCPLKCTFCFHPSGDKYRKRSLDNIFQEIDYLIDTYHPKALIVSDELFAPKRDRVIEFCKRIAKYKISWSVQLRVCDVDEEMLNIMRDSGCSTISYGIESADDRILTSMAKKITREQIDRALELTYAAGIDIQGGLIFGDADETMETVGNSLKWYDENIHYGLELNMINIFPGTGLYNNAVARNIIKDRVKFLTDGCPLINVSNLSDQEYRDLSSNLYERNMRAKYEPHAMEVNDIQDDGICTIRMTCNQCGHVSSIKTDNMHIRRMTCRKCRQRYYLNPLKNISRQPLPDRNFEQDNRVVLWGGGEICIQMLDYYPDLQSEKFVVVDSSKSRQGYSVCCKPIFPPSYISEHNVSTVILTVVRRKEEILRQLAAFPGITNIYLPQTARIDDTHAEFYLGKI